MRILIATGLSGTDSGGPAQYGPKLKKEFETLGHHVKLVKYNSIESALLGIWPKVLWANKIIALDTFSVGVPALLAAKLFGKRIVVRIGGDFLWESYVERTGDRVTLRQFNISRPVLSLKEMVIFYLTKILTKYTDVLAFNTEWQKKIWIKAYNISDDKAVVIKNFIPEKQVDNTHGSKKFLWAGRKVKLKNLELLQEVASEIRSEISDFELEVVSSMPHSQLQDIIRDCYAVVLPSFSEVCPNFVLEAISYGKPFIMTEETGLKEIYDKGGLFIDSFDKTALKEGLMGMLDNVKYEQCKKDQESIQASRPWKVIAEEFLSLCK